MPLFKIVIYTLRFMSSFSTLKGHADQLMVTEGLARADLRQHDLVINARRAVLQIKRS